MVKSLPANAGDIETWVRFLGGEGPLEEGTETHSGVLNGESDGKRSGP